ncbi:hypothetical protein TNCV_199301 [Trichonephila clavipes]|nr:hypothetical protein TNCV_199301 [Trichonephila clavipes]
MKTSRAEKLYVKSVVTQSILVGIVWKFGMGCQLSFVIFIWPWFKLRGPSVIVLVGLLSATQIKKNPLLLCIWIRFKDPRLIAKKVAFFKQSAIINEIFLFRAIMISSIVLLIVASLLCTRVIALPSEETCASKEDIKTSLQRLAIANNDMAVNLYKMLSVNSVGNLAFSPLSISLAFGMLHYGVRGNTSAVSIMFKNSYSS